MKRISALPLLGAALAALLSSTASARLTRRDDENATAAAFVTSTPYGNITFAATAVKDVGDLYFHLEAPADNSWVAIGSGKDMQGSMMWIVYDSGDGKGVTFSPRISTDHVEPTYDAKLPCGLNQDAGSTPASIMDRDGKKVFVVNGRCRDVNNRAGFKRSLASSLTRRGTDDLDADGKLNFDATAQNFMFALGPTDRKLQSDSKTAGIRRHSMYGTFTMDLKSATADTTNDVDQAAMAKVGTWQMKGAQLVGDPERDRDWTGPLHSVAMCGTYLVLFPIGVIFLRVLEKVMWHAIMQGVGVVFIIGGVGLGFYIGREYNHSRDVKSVHQILGLSIAALTLVQFGLGLAHHLIYRRTQSPTMLGKIHRFFGPFLLCIGAANGFLGFNFSGASYHDVMYGIIVAVIFVLLAGILFWTARRKGIKAKRANTRLGNEVYEGFTHKPQGYGGRGDDIPLRTYPTDDPPSYEGSRGVTPRPMV